MSRAIRAAALAVTVGVSLTLVATAPTPVEAAKKPPKPVITKVDPKSGPTTGGTVVTIKGKHLKTATKVLFGSTKGTRLKVKSDKKLKVTTPAHAPGTVNVKVKTKGGKSARTRVARFTFVAEKPAITGISPSSGPDTGGTVVTVTGTGFTGVSGVTFGGSPGSAVQVVSPTQLRVTSPAHPAGLLHVNVTTSAGTSPSKSGDLFRFLPVPRAAVAPLPADAKAADPGVSLNAVSCPAEQVCFAVGGYLVDGDIRRPLVERRTGPDTWAATSPAAPADADTSADIELRDVACPSATFCVAVGTYLDDSPVAEYHPLIETWDGSTWTASSPAMPADSGFQTDKLLDDVACASTTACVAVGRYDENVGGDSVGLVVSLTGGTWSSHAVPSPSAGSTTSLFAVDCPVATACVTVGEETTATNARYPFIVTGSGTTWTAVASPPLPANAAADPQVELRSVSCISSGACVAAGSYLTGTGKKQGLLEVQGAPWTAVAVPAPGVAATNPAVQLHEVSCSGSCAAVGGYKLASGETRPVVVNLSGTTASVYQGTLPSDAALGANASSYTVTCATTQRCVGVGYYEADTLPQAPLLSNLGASGWTAAAGPSPSDLGPNIRPLASSMDGSVAIAVGYYVDDSIDNATRPLIMVDIPVT